MHGASLLLPVVAILASTISALPAASGVPFQVTHLSIQAVKSANTTIKFTVYDPDPLTNATQSCTAIWTTGSGGYPKGSYKTCGNSTFAWNMYAYTNMQHFVLGLEHKFKDPSIGNPPYDQIITFGKGNVTSADLVCTAVGGWAGCEQPRDQTIRAPIYAVTAKRR
ncbi:hypothetical protein LTR53_005301 [Teratosphaeriaceae sp. CCFEE 6253]|nr:hypothetical protein LTR53_005301 [Teratosphaeriaceae sp. CCFEE 6253]